MGIETAITKVGTKMLTQARRAYVKPACKVCAMGKTIESKIKPLVEDVITIGNKTKTLNTSLVTKPNNLILLQTTCFLLISDNTIYSLFILRLFSEICN